MTEVFAVVDASQDTAEGYAVVALYTSRQTAEQHADRESHYDVRQLPVLTSLRAY